MSEPTIKIPKSLEALSSGTKALLQDDSVTVQIAGSHEAQTQVMYQLQRDVTNDKSLAPEEGWALITALRMVHDYTSTFSAAGEAVLKIEKKARDSRKVITHEPPTQ